MHSETRNMINNLIEISEKWICKRKKETKNWSEYQDKCKKTQEGRDRFYEEYGKSGIYHQILRALRDVLNTEDINNYNDLNEEHSNVYKECWNCSNKFVLEGHQYCSKCGVTLVDSEEGCGNGVTEKERNLLGYLHDALTDTYDDPTFELGKECQMIHSIHYHLWINRDKFSEEDQNLIKNIEVVMNKVWDKKVEEVKASKQ